MIEPTGREPRTPRWVIVSGLLAALAAVLVVVLLLLGGHGPGRHDPADGTGVTGHVPATGGHG